MKLQVIDNATGEVISTHLFPNEEPLTLCLNTVEDGLKELPCYEKGCYTIIHSFKSTVLNRFVL